MRCTYAAMLDYAKTTNESPTDVGSAAYSFCIKEWMLVYPSSYADFEGMLPEYKLQNITREAVIRGMADEVVRVRAKS